MSNLNLAMVLLVKNEVDIIERNIRFHHAQGINHFLVMDNGSTDGTLDVLNALRSELDVITIENPEGVYQQSLWMTQLARQAKQYFGATHVIPNDADEFWLPKSGFSLPQALLQRPSVQTVKRYNMVLTHAMCENAQPFYHADCFVHSPILYEGETQVHDDLVSMQMVKISPKVIVRPTGLIRIKGGNHRASHLVPARAFNPDIEVFHYPLRSYKQFEANVANRAGLLDRPKVRMGPHYRRWVRYYNEGMLAAEFERLVPTETQVKTLLDVGVLRRQERLPTLMQNLL